MVRLDFFEALIERLELPQVRFAHQAVTHRWAVLPPFPCPQYPLISLTTACHAVMWITNPRLNYAGLQIQRDRRKQKQRFILFFTLTNYPDSVNIQASKSNIYCIRYFSALKWLEKITESMNAVYITFYTYWIPAIF